MLQFDPNKRYSAKQLLSHSFLSSFDKSLKNNFTKIPKQEFYFEMLDLNTEQLKDVAYEEILFHHFEKYKEIWENRLKSEKNPYLNFLENENKEYDDGEDTEFEGSEDSFCFCLLYTSPSPRDLSTSRMPSSA